VYYHSYLVSKIRSSIPPSLSTSFSCTSMDPDCHFTQSRVHESLHSDMDMGMCMVACLLGIGVTTHTSSDGGNIWVDAGYRIIMLMVII
jgi:hypothetical protein